MNKKTPAARAVELISQLEALGLESFTMPNGAASATRVGWTPRGSSRMPAATSARNAALAPYSAAKRRC